MQAENTGLRSQNGLLKGERQRLESEIREGEVRSREQERLVRQLQEQQEQQQQQQQQQQFISSSGPQNYFDHSSILNHFGRDSSSASLSSSRALDHLTEPPTQAPPTQAPPSDRDGSVLSIIEATRLQNEFDKEDRALSAQRAVLAKSTQRLFECGICMEEMPDDSIARPDPCGHAFCRECLRGHVTARLNEHRFPILCPTCTAGKGKGKEAAGGT